MVRLVSRRAALSWAAAAVAPVPAWVRAARPVAANSTSRKTFRLATGCGAAGGCSCNACKSHAANKLFASRADVVRAHHGCNCRVEIMSLPNNIWIALFGLPERPTTTAVDKRDPNVRDILAHLPHHHRRRPRHHT